jgi:hypothetical protein
MFTGRTKPIQTIGVPDNQRPEKLSSTLLQDISIFLPDDTVSHSGTQFLRTHGYENFKSYILNLCFV